MCVYSGAEQPLTSNPERKKVNYAWDRIARGLSQGLSRGGDDPAAAADDS